MDSGHTVKGRIIPTLQKPFQKTGGRNDYPLTSRLTYSFCNQTARAEKVATWIEQNTTTGVPGHSGFLQHAKLNAYGTATPKPTSSSINAARTTGGQYRGLEDPLPPESRQRLHTTGQERDAGVSRHCWEGQMDRRTVQDEPLPGAG